MTPTPVYLGWTNPKGVGAYLGNRDLLRTFIEERYGPNLPELRWVESIPSEDGGGTRYLYSDGSMVEGRNGSWLWFSDSTDIPNGDWDPIR